MNHVRIAFNTHLVGIDSKLDTYMTCPHRYYLNYLDPDAKSKSTVPMLRGSSLHESLAHFANLYNLVYQEIEQDESTSASGLFLTEEDYKAKVAFAHSRPVEGVDLEVDFANNIVYNKKIALDIVKKIKTDVELNRRILQCSSASSGTEENNLTNPAPEFLDLITERAVKTFRKHVVGSGMKESVYVPNDVIEESTEMLKKQIRRELESVVVPPLSLFEFDQNTAKQFGMSGKRRPILIEESFVLTSIGGVPGLDLVVIFDRVDIELDENNQPKYVMVEYKSSIKPKYLSGFEKQLSIYHYAFKQLFGETISKSQLTCLKTGQVYTFTDDQFDHVATENLIIEYATKILEDEEFVAKPDMVRCKFCTLQHVCKHAYNSEQARIDRHIKFSQNRRIERIASQSTTSTEDPKDVE